MERRERLALTAALLLHAGLLVARREAPPAAGARPAEVRDPIELLYEPGEALIEREPGPGDGAMAAKREEGSASPAPVHARSAPASPRRGVPIEPEAETPSVMPGSAAAGQAVLGLPGEAPVWAIPGVLGPMERPKPAPTAAPVARPVDRDIAGRVVDDALKRRDHDLGLDAPGAGVVASVIADAVRSGAVPDDVRATFEARIGANGAVQGVKVTSASAGGAPAWERVARAARGALQGRTLQTRNSAGATTVVVQIESKLQYPAGGLAKVEAERVCLSEVVEPMVAGPEDPGSTRNDTPRAALKAGLPPPTSNEVDEGRKNACVPVWVRARGDLSNIGAHRQKVVRSRFSVRRD